MHAQTKLAAIALTALAAYVGPVVQAQTLNHLTTIDNTVAAGDAKCPDQPFYLYSGGKKDNYAAPADSVYPRPELAAFVATCPTMSYDPKTSNACQRDSFNLQNTRSVCHAIIEFKTKFTGDVPGNDGFSIGHVDGAGTFQSVAGMSNPYSVTTGVQRFSLDDAGLALLSVQTGVNMDKTPQDSVLDLFAQDDFKVDYFHIWVWYGKNCAETASC